MDLLITVLIGLVAGYLASIVMKGGSKSWLYCLIVGVIGAFIGSWLFGILGLGAYGLVGEILIAFVGSCILMFILGKL